MLWVHNSFQFIIHFSCPQSVRNSETAFLPNKERSLYSFCNHPILGLLYVKNLRHRSKSIALKEERRLRQNRLRQGIVKPRQPKINQVRPQQVKKVKIHQRQIKICEDWMQIGDLIILKKNRTLTASRHLTTNKYNPPQQQNMFSHQLQVSNFLKIDLIL